MIEDGLKRRQLEERLKKAKADKWHTETKLEKEAYTDALTGIPNRRGFKLIMRKQYEENNLNNDPKNPKIVMADIDFFKKVNDTFGHVAGDEVLKQVANHLRKSVREDDVVARFGGEEFILILNDVPKGSAAQLVTSLCARIAELSVEWEGRRIPITMSFGIADDDSAETLDKAIGEADSALYAAKRAGRNRVQHWSEVSAEAA